MALLDSPLRWLQTAVERRTLQLATGFFHVHERRWIDEAPKPPPAKTGRSLLTALDIRGIQVRVNDDDLERAIRDDKRISYVRQAMEFFDSHEEYGRVNPRKISVMEGLSDNAKRGIRRTACNYPGFFTVLVNNRRMEDHMVMTPEAKQLLEDERRVRFNCGEAACIRVVKKILMMCKDRRFPRKKLKFLQGWFAFPYDFYNGFLSRHPRDVRIVETPEGDYVELVSWDDALAVSEREKAVAQELTARNQGEYAFVISYPETYKLNALRHEELDRFQRLPFASPYEFSRRMFDTPEGQKRVVGVFHELLSLTAEKKADMTDLARLAEVLNLPRKFSHLVLSCHPGIFYVSGNMVFLREAYKRSDVVVKDEHPFVDIRRRYKRLMKMRPVNTHTHKESYRYIPKMERGYWSNKDQSRNPSKDTFQLITV